MPSTPIKDRLTQINTVIKDVSHETQLPQATLIAISKHFSANIIEQALEAGQMVFGENKVQEAAQKWPALRQKYPHVQLHMVGPLQTNKVAQAVDIFDVIETLDRPKLAQKLSRIQKEKGKDIPCFIQVNTGEEPQKAGVSPHETADFIAFCQKDCGLSIQGLMCVPPQGEEPSIHFAFLRKLALENNLKQLSMGMSHDFEKALLFGASFIRIGRGIFGERPPIV